MRRLRIAAALVAAMLLAGAAPPSADQAAADRVRGHVEFLASDELEGRETGSRGHAVAARYVAAQFVSLGLKPGGSDGNWYQQVPFRRAAHAGVPTVTFVSAGKSFQLVSGKDFGLQPSLATKQLALDAGLVFAGHGISDARMRVDEYAGLDVSGKIVVVLEGTPPGLPGDVAAHLDTAKEETAARKGAAGFIEIKRQASSLERWNRPFVYWVEQAGRRGPAKATLTQGALSAEWAARIFEGSKSTLEAVRAAGRRGPVQGFALPGRLQVKATSEWQDFASPAVIGVLPGADPVLKGEHVVLMGHLDHLGLKKDAKPGEDNVYNGALDNAAGVATMLEAAQEFVSSGKPPRRSLLFIAHTGEEIGLLGSEYYVQHPTVPIEGIVGVVDLDMPVPLYEFNDVVAFGADHSTVVLNVEQAAKSMGMTVSPDPMPEQSIFVRSDHYRFVLRGVPAILLFTGYGNGGKARWDHFFANTYHTVRDDMRQPINWRAAAKYGQLNYRIARALADADSRPLWYKGDYFGETFASGQPRAEVRR